MQMNFKTNYADHYIAWKMSKCGVLSGPYFPKFGLKMEICSSNLCIQSEYRKIQTRKNSVFGHFSSSVYIYDCSKITIIDQHQEHTLAGSLRIIRDNNLKKLSSKEPEYGENKTKLPWMGLLKAGALNVVMTKTIFQKLILEFTIFLWNLM